MKSRIQPEQITLKGEKDSLLLGGFIRITPRTPDLVFLAYNFTPLEEHRTQTEKAIAIQEQTSDLRVENISMPGTGQHVKLAGSFPLKFDVTRERAGPITRHDAVNIAVERLPYRVLAVDILVEGCGWVEITAQVRTRNLYETRREETRPHHDTTDDLLLNLNLSEPGPEADEGRDAAADGTRDAWEPNWPLVDVYAPGGKFIGSRRPMNGWLLCKPKKSKCKSRPRKSAKGAKKQAKVAARVGGLEARKPDM